MADESLICRYCGVSFVFDEGQQRVFRERHYPDKSSRCNRCRTTRRAQQTEHVTTDVTCSACGKLTQVPFVLQPGFAVLCRQCLAQARPKSWVGPVRPPVNRGRRA
jgi:CxxC-x17-CxxC domain-containing protein